MVCAAAIPAQADEDDPKPVPARAGRSGDEGPISSNDEHVHYALRLDGRGLFMPASVMSPFLKEAQGLTSGSIGASFVRRKGALDVVVSLDWGAFSPKDGNFLGSGNDASIDTHWVHFANLSVLSADVSFYYNHDLTKWLAITVGAGLGIGVVLGDIYEINGSGTVCNPANAGDTSKCYPVVDPAQYQKYGNPVPTYVNASGMEVPFKSGALKVDDPEFQAKLSGLEASYAKCPTAKAGDCRDTSDHPYYHKVDKIPVVPVLNVSLGFKFKLHRHWNLNMAGGFRNAFFFGGGPEYVF